MSESNNRKDRLEAKKTEKELAKKRQIRERIILWGVATLLLVGFVGVLWKLGGGTAARTYVGGVDTLQADDHVEGNASASTTLIEYSDFQCPSCYVAYPYVKDVLQAYGDRVRIVYRQYPLPQHANSHVAAAASEAAARQGKFWPMHDMLFQNQSEWSSLADPTDVFVRYATALGLNPAAFRTDLTLREVDDRIARDIDAGTDFGVDGTPSFFLNGYRLTLPSYASLKDTVGQELDKK